METSKNCRIYLPDIPPIKMNGVPLISTTRLYKVKRFVYTSPQLASESAFHAYMTPLCLESIGLLARAAYRCLTNKDLVRTRSYFFLSNRCITRADSISLAPIGTDIAFYTYSKLQTYFLRKTSNDGVVSADSRQLFYQISLNRCNNQRRR